MCYLGGRYGSKRSYKFRIIQITEIDDQFLTILTIPEKDWPQPSTLTFGHVAVKNLRVGDYLRAETEDDKQFKNFQRCIDPSNPIPISDILKASAEEKAGMLEQRAVNKLRDSTQDVDSLIDQLKSAMWDLSPSKRKSFALYVYLRLSK